MSIAKDQGLTLRVSRYFFYCNKRLAVIGKKIKRKMLHKKQRLNRKKCNNLTIKFAVAHRFLPLRTDLLKNFPVMLN